MSEEYQLTARLFVPNYHRNKKLLTLGKQLILLPFETGLWLLIAVIATAFTFFALKVIGKTAIAFNMIAVALWMGLAIIHAGGLEVSTSSTNLTYDGAGALQFNETKSEMFIPGGTQANWLSYLFLGFALFAMFNVFRGFGLINGL